MAKQYDKEFQENAVRYYHSHRELGIKGCAANLGISKSALSTWDHAANNVDGKEPFRRSGYIKKSNRHSGKLTQAIYMEVFNKSEELHGECRLSVSGVLKQLGVSKSGYQAWKNRLPSNQQKRKEAVQAKIMDIYEESHQNYGAPKITEKLHKEGEKISERTVGKYMKELNIKAQYVKPYTVTTINADFDKELLNLLNEEFNPEEPNAVWCSDITYIWTFEGFVYLTSNLLSIVPYKIPADFRSKLFLLFQYG